MIHLNNDISITTTNVAIVSLYARNNYGNCLQRRAVHELIEGFGYKPVSLDARSVTRGMVKEKAYEWLSSIGTFGNVKIARARGFLRFDSACNCLRVRRDRVDKLEEHFAAFVVGSDQVWNPEIWDFEASYNLLGFVRSTKKRIALSPSFGVSELREEYRKIFATELSEYSRLSVREVEGATIIEELINKKASVLCDPTIALGRKRWKAISDTKMIPSSPYVLVYQLGSSEKCRDEAKKVAIEQNYKIVYLNDSSDRFFAADPADFVGLIFNASIVFTDSFHASVFSIMGHTPFKVFPREGSNYSMSSRISTLGDIFNIQMEDYSQNYDWNKIDAILESLEIDFKLYLRSEFSRVFDLDNCPDDCI